MRSDIFDIVSKVDPDKDKRSNDVLRWNPDLLVRLLGLRIQHSLRVDNPPDACWRQVFPARVGTQSVEDYVMSRTLMRPRDVINFATACVVEAQDRFHNKVTEDDINRAETKYSESRLVDLEQEFMATYPGLSRAFEAFLGGQSNLPEGALRPLIVSHLSKLARDNDCPEWLRNITAGDLLRVLYEIKFLGVRLPSGAITYSYDRDYGRALAAAKKPRHIPWRPRRKRQHPRPTGVTFVVHPAFRSYLELN